MPNLSENSFQDGYNRGFSDGKASKSLKVQNQTQTNNNLIEGAGNSGSSYQPISSSVDESFNDGYERGVQIAASMNDYMQRTIFKKRANLYLKYFAEPTLKNAKKLYKLNRRYLKYGGVLSSLFDGIKYEHIPCVTKKSKKCKE